jgi:hypothetical protein
VPTIFFEWNVLTASGGHAAERGRARPLCPPYALPPAHVIVHNAHDPATMAAALALAVDQDNADVKPGKRGNQRDTLAQ